MIFEWIRCSYIEALSFDLSLFQFIHNFAGKWKLLDWLGIFFADYLGYFLVLGAIYLLFRQKKWQETIYFFSLAALSTILSRGIITEIIRLAYHRLRPFLALNFQPLIEHGPSGSMPSGNAAFFFALALAIFYINRKWGIWFLVLSLSMGMGRVFVGVHWPMDILAGAIIGLVSATFVKNLLLSPLKEEASTAAS